MPEYLIEHTGYNHKQILAAFLNGIEFHKAVEKSDGATCKKIRENLEKLQGDPDE